MTVTSMAMKYIIMEWYTDEWVYDETNGKWNKVGRVKKCGLVQK